MAGKIVQVEYTASPTAAKFHNSPAMFRGIMGPVGSGKSTACCFEIFRLACAQRPNVQGIRKSKAVIVRNTLPELKTTTMASWKIWFPPGNPAKDPTTFGHMTGVPPYIHYVKYSLPDGTKVDLEVLFLALDQAEDAKKLLSLECSFIWFNECREIPKEIIDAGQQRIGRYPSFKDGGCTRKAIIADTNPPDDEHYWYNWAEVEKPAGYEFFKQPGGLDPDAENLEFLEQPGNAKDLTIAERREFGRRYYIDMIPGKDPAYIDVMVNGNYGTLLKGSPVFGNLWIKNLHQVPTILIRGKVPVTVGVDSSGRHPALVYLQPDGCGRWEAPREIAIMDKVGMGAETFSKYFVEDMKRHFHGAPIDEIWGDPAGLSPSQNDERTYFDILNSELKKWGLRVKPSPSFRWPERFQAVEWLLSTLHNGKPLLTVSQEGCPVLCAGFNGKYMFKEFNTAGGGSRVDDRPIKNLHSNPQDALQYAAGGIRVRFGDFKRDRPARKIQTVTPKFRF
jgi:hypothetical protein